MSDAGVTRPYPEARGPHLPDTLTRIPTLAYAFALAAAFLVWQAIQSAASGADSASLGELAQFLVRALIPTALIPLLGFVLVVRHPDAPRSMRLLLFGIGLLTIRELIGAFDAPIRDVLRGSDPSVEFETAGEIAYRMFRGLLIIFGFLYLGAGLADARGPERSAVERPLTVWLGAFAAVGVAISLYSLVRVLQDQPPAIALVSNVLSVAIASIVTFCWVYIGSVVIGGFLARATPRRAWTAAAIALVLLFATQLIGLAALTFASEALLPVFIAITYVGILGWVLLLVAFALGLPAGETDATADPPAMTQPGSEAG